MDNSLALHFTTAKACISTRLCSSQPFYKNVRDDYIIQTWTLQPFVGPCPWWYTPPSADKTEEAIKNALNVTSSVTFVRAQKGTKQPYDDANIKTRPAAKHWLNVLDQTGHELGRVPHSDFIIYWKRKWKTRESSLLCQCHPMMNQVNPLINMSACKI